MTRNINSDTAHEKLELFLELSKERATTHPFIVVMLMHEYFRCLYPDDPFIEKRYAEDNLENIILCLDMCIQTLKVITNMGSYFSGNSSLENYMSNFEQEAQYKTQVLYGKLWKKRMAQKSLDSTEELKESFERNGFDIEYVKGKNVLDMGCGSGRFTIALAKLGAGHVTGVDLGDDGLEIARELSASDELRNVTFEKHSVLDLPYEDESFDFVFCKGVLHHTGNLNRGLDEYYRVMKRGGQGFLYLYGSGGLFWNSRRRMRDVMQLIPIEYSIRVLDLIGMPARRTIFIDSWYVPIEEHVNSESLEGYLTKLGFSKIERWKKGSIVELESMIFSDVPHAKELWGEGELRYILEK